MLRALKPILFNPWTLSFPIFMNKHMNNHLYQYNESKAWKKDKSPFFHSTRDPDGAVVYWFDRAPVR